MLPLAHVRRWFGWLAIIALLGQIMLVSWHIHDHHAGGTEVSELSAANTADNPASDHDDGAACEICLAAVVAGAALLLALYVIGIPVYAGPRVIAETRHGDALGRRIRPFQARAPPALAVQI